MSTATIKVARTVKAKPSSNGVVPMEVSEDSATSRHAFVPDGSYATNYVHRMVEGINDFRLLDYCLANQINLLLRGNTGSGKTMLPMAYAAAEKIPYYSVPCDVSIEPSALLGKMMPTDRIGEFKWSDGPVTEMVRYGGVLNISEVNFMPARIAASLYSLLDHRRSLKLLGHEGEHITAHPDLLIVADMNPKYRGTVDLNLALANRFAIKVDWDYDGKVEDVLVKSPTLLDLVRKIRGNTEIRTPISTNAMLEFVTFAQALGLKFAVLNFMSAFADSERATVGNLLDATSVEIASDIAKLSGGKIVDADLEELEYDPSEYEIVEE